MPCRQRAENGDEQGQKPGQGGQLQTRCGAAAEAFCSSTLRAARGCLPWLRRLVLSHLTPARLPPSGSQLKQNAAALTLKVCASGPPTPDVAHWLVWSGQPASRLLRMLSTSCGFAEAVYGYRFAVQNLLAAVHLHVDRSETEGAQRQQAPEGCVRGLLPGFC